MTALIHFNRSLDADVINSVIRRGGSQPAPNLADLTTVSPEPASWRSERDGRINAYAVFRKQTPSRGLLEISCAQDARPEDADELICRVIEYARSSKLTGLIGYAQMGAGPLHELFDRTGCNPTGTLRKLTVPTTLHHADPPLSDNLFIRRFETLNHIPTLSALLNRAYADRFGRPENEHKAVTNETIQAYLDAPGNEAARRSFWLILNNFGKGICVTRVHENRWIEAPGTVPEERGNGYAMSLLANVLREMRNDDLYPKSMLSYDEPVNRIAAYEFAGFQVENSWTGYYKDLKE